MGPTSSVSVLVTESGVTSTVAPLTVNSKPAPASAPCRLTDPRTPSIVACPISRIAQSVNSVRIDSGTLILMTSLFSRRS